MTREELISALKNVYDIERLSGKIAYENANAMKNYNYTSIGSISCGTTDYPWLNRNSPNKTRQAWVLCNENYKLGCAQHEFSVNVTAEGENEAVTIKDKNGSNQTCIIKKCMDYTNPTCTLNVTGTQSPHSGYYYGDKVSISFASKSDSLSGLDAMMQQGHLLQVLIKIIVFHHHQLHKVKKHIMVM